MGWREEACGPWLAIHVSETQVLLVQADDTFGNKTLDATPENMYANAMSILGLVDTDEYMALRAVEGERRKRVELRRAEAIANEANLALIEARERVAG